MPTIVYFVHTASIGRRIYFSKGKFKAFFQWKQFFSQASDDLEKELHPLEEYGAKLLNMTLQPFSNYAIKY